MALFGNKASDNKAAAPKKTVKKAASKDAEAVSMQDLYGEEKSVKTSATASKASKTVKNAGVSNQVIIKPLVTEKAANLVSENKYCFVVAKGANKVEIAKAVKAIYDVKAIKVNVSNFEGKQVQRGRVRGQRSDWRKAVVTLAKGDSIQLYEGV